MFLPKPAEDVGMFVRPARDTRERKRKWSTRKYLDPWTNLGWSHWVEEWTQKKDLLDGHPLEGTN